MGMLSRTGGAWVLVAGLGGLAAPVCADAASIDPPQGRPFLTTTASGVQIYSCEYDVGHRLEWVFKSPRATLYNTSGQPVVDHAAGPSWQAGDGSRITGKVLAQIPGDAPGSIPQLLLEAHRASGGPGNGLLSDIRYVQRINTSGGVKPTAACSVEHAMGSSPYIANYIFYK